MDIAILAIRTRDGKWLSEISESVVPLMELRQRIRVSGVHEGAPIDRGMILSTANMIGGTQHEFTVDRVAVDAAQKRAKK
jgi:hypothetical protein